MDGPTAWRALHMYAVRHYDSSVEDWFQAWKETIPDYGCNCRSGFEKVLVELPPVYRPQEAFIRWTWRVHNRVNSKLKKPTFTWEEFVRMYEGSCIKID